MHPNPTAARHGLPSNGLRGTHRHPVAACLRRVRGATASAALLALAGALTGCATGPRHPVLVAAESAGTLAPLRPTRAFVAQAERTGGFVLSPDGRRLLWSQTVGLDHGLAVQRVDTPDIVSTFATGHQGRGSALYTWLADSRHLVYSRDETGDENTRLLVLDADDPLAPPWAATPARGVRARYLGRGPAGSTRFFLASNARDRRTFDLLEADAATRQVREVARSDGRVLAWFIDLQGRLAARQRQLGDADGSDTVLEWRQPDGRWQTVLTSGGFDQVTVLRVDGDTGQAWLLSNQGRDKAALRRLDLASGVQTVLAEHPVVDITAAVFVAGQAGPVAALAEPDWPVALPLDTAFGNELARAVARARAEGVLPDEPRLTRVQGSADGGRRLVLRSLGDADIAEWLWDRDEGRVTRLNSRSAEGPAELAAVQPFAFDATDGRRLHGYLIRPRGVDGPVPLVVDIHGGPWMRDSWSPAVPGPRQLLANRGYAVMTLNYRGSAGYGREHLWAGARVYDTRLQQDVAEAAQWAVEQGVADPRHLAVLGASFGGFSVLSQLAQRPQMWRCGVDVVGVADWSRLMADWPPFWRNRHWFERFYGNPQDPAEREDMRRRSPLAQLDAIRAPLLVAHGGGDIRVLRRDSDEVVAALRARGHPVQYLLFPDEGHAISKWRNRLALWRAIETHFADCLGGRDGGFDFYELMPRVQAP